MLLQVASMTDAVRMKKKLRQMGMPSEVVQTPPRARRGGCGYSVRIQEKALQPAETAAREIGVRILGVLKGEPL